jgi:hypothetical protein
MLLVIIVEDSAAFVFVEDEVKVFAVGFLKEGIGIEVAGYFGYFHLFVDTEYFGHSTEDGG